MATGGVTPAVPAGTHRRAVFLHPEFMADYVYSSNTSIEVPFTAGSNCMWYGFQIGEHMEIPEKELVQVPIGDRIRLEQIDSLADAASFEHLLGFVWEGLLGTLVAFEG